MVATIVIFTTKSQSPMDIITKQLLNIGQFSHTFTQVNFL